MAVEHKRVRSLDGLRGVAAVVVLLNHAIVVYPFLDAVHTSEQRIEEAGSLGWWLVHTPLHLTWAGREAVFTFFILSGIVLTFPVIKAARFRWREYYPQRLLRLYLPVWGSLVLAIALVGLITLAAPVPGQGWLEGKQDRIQSPALLADLLLLTDGANINGPLWSLRWEVLFSILLPLYVVFAVKLRKWWAAKIVVVLAVAWVGSVPLHGSGGSALFYMSMFALGCIAAVEWDGLRAVAERIDAKRSARLIWALLMVITALLLSSYWLALAADVPAAVLRGAPVVALVGAALLVYQAAFNPGFRTFLECRPVQWLGAVSFSLYITHVPVLHAINAFAEPEARPLVMIVGVPLALLTAHIFFRLVEAPSHRFSHFVRQRVRSRYASRSVGAAATF